MASKRKGKPAKTREVKIEEPKKSRKKKKRMNPKLKRFLKISAISFGVFILLIGIALGLAARYEDEISEAIIRELNKNLTTEVKIGSIDLDLIRSFPNASVDLRDVVVPGKFGGSLLRTELMAFKFNVFSLMGKTYKIKSVVINDGLLQIKKNKRGQNNYDITKPRTETTTSDKPINFSIQLNSTTFKKIDLRYEDQIQDNEALLFLDYFTLSGNFSDERTILKTNAEMESTFVSIGDDEYLPNSLVAWDFDIDADFQKGVYEIKNSTLDLHANTFKASGIVKDEDGLNDIDVQLKGDDCTILSVITILPERYKNAIKDFNSRGSFYFNVDIDGKYGDESFPAVDAQFGLKNGQITSPRLGESLKQVNFDASFSSKENKDSAVFDMTGFEAKLNEKLLNIDLKLENIADPKIDFRFNGDVDLALVYKLSNNPFIKDGSGLIKVQDLLLKGRYKDMINSNRLSRVDASGIVDFQDFQIKYANENFRLQKGYLTFTNELITARSIELLGLNSDFNLNLNLYNTLPVLLSEEDSGQKIFFDGEMRSNNIDFDKILSLGLKTSEASPEVQVPTTEETNDTLTEKGVDYTSLIRGRFKADIKKFNFRKVNGENFRGEVEYNNKELVFREVDVDAMEGHLRLTSNIRLKGAPRLEAFLEFKNINGKEFFKQGENFGQNVLIDKNIKGTLDGKMIINAYWDKDYNFLYDKLYSLLDLTIRQGELIDFKMMEDFASYVKIQDLKHIKFTDMRNQLQIKDGKVIVPSMFLQSNALNMHLAGTYDFNDNIDFKFKINAGQVIANKFKRFNPNRNPKKAKRKGWINLYVSMKGNLYKALEMKYRDKKEVLEALEGNLSIEFQKIQNTIKSKFDSDPLTEPLDWDDEDNGNDGDFGDF